MATARFKEHEAPIIMELTYAEAVALVTLYGRVGGPFKGARGQLSGITDALTGLGVDADPTLWPNDSGDSGVYFK